MEMVVLDRFSGGNDPEGWILRAEQYFTYLGFSQKDWLPLPYFYLDGEALTWFTWLHHNKQFFDWKHFTEKLLIRFPQRTFTTSVSMADTSRAYIDYVRYATFAPSAMSPSAGVDLSHVKHSSSDFLDAFTSGSREADHMLAKSPEKYTNVDSLALLTESNAKIATVEGLGTSQIENAKSIEADLVQEPSSITAGQVFDEISDTTVSSSIPELNYRFCEDVSMQTKVPTSVLNDTKGPNSAEEDNSLNNVALFDKSPLVGREDMMSNEHLEQDMPTRYVVTYSLGSDSPKWKPDLETFTVGVEDLFLDKYFLENEIFIPTSDMHSVEVPLNAEHEIPTGGCDQLNLSQFPFDPGATFVTIPNRLTATDHWLWDSRLYFTFMALTVFTVNVAALQSQGYSVRFCLIAYSNSMTRVWDPGQSWCANSSILQSDSALAVALSPNFPHFYIVERGLSFHLTTRRRNILVFMLAWHGENMARYMDMRTLEKCLLKVNVFASLGTLLLWKDNCCLESVAKYLCSFWSASIMLIFASFHCCKSEGLDYKIICIPFQMFMTSFIFGSLLGIDDYSCAFGTSKHLVSRLAFFVSTQLVFSVGLGERNCATYSIQVVVVLTIGVGIVDIGAGKDMQTRNSTDAKILVPYIAVWTAETCSLFIPRYPTLRPYHEETVSANLVFSTTLRICYMVYLHNAFVVMHSLSCWIEQLTMIFNQCSVWENKMKHMWLYPSYGIVITLPFDGIDVQKYVSHYKSDILLLMPLLYLNLEDKVLIEDGSIVMNQPRPNVNIYKDITQLVIGSRRSNRTGPSQRLIWDPGPINN